MMGNGSGWVPEPLREVNLNQIGGAQSPGRLVGTVRPGDPELDP